MLAVFRFWYPMWFLVFPISFFLFGPIWVPPKRLPKLLRNAWQTGCRGRGSRASNDNTHDNMTCYKLGCVLSHQSKVLVPKARHNGVSSQCTVDDATIRSQPSCKWLWLITQLGLSIWCCSKTKDSAAGNYNGQARNIARVSLSTPSRSWW